MLLDPSALLENEFSELVKMPDSPTLPPTKRPRLESENSAPHIMDMDTDVDSALTIPLDDMDTNVQITSFGVSLHTSQTDYQILRAPRSHYVHNICTCSDGIDSAWFAPFQISGTYLFLSLDAVM
jgi:hypothetical protein